MRLQWQLARSGQAHNASAPLRARPANLGSTMDVYTWVLGPLAALPGCGPSLALAQGRAAKGLPLDVSPCTDLLATLETVHVRR